MDDGLSLVGEVMYRGVEGKVTDIEDGVIIDDVDVDLSGWVGNVGVAWRF